MTLLSELIDIPEQVHKGDSAPRPSAAASFRSEISSIW